MQVTPMQARVQYGQHRHGERKRVDGPVCPRSYLLDFWAFSPHDVERNLPNNQVLLCNARETVVVKGNHDSGEGGFIPKAVPKRPCIEDTFYLRAKYPSKTSVVNTARHNPPDRQRSFAFL